MTYGWIRKRGHSYTLAGLICGKIQRENMPRLCQLGLRFKSSGLSKCHSSLARQTALLLPTSTLAKGESRSHSESKERMVDFFPKVMEKKRESDGLTPSFLNIYPSLNFLLSTAVATRLSLKNGFQPSSPLLPGAPAPRLFLSWLFLFDSPH